MSCQRGLQSYEIYFNHQLCTPLLHGRTIKLSEKYPNSTWNPLVSDFILIILIAAVQVQPDVGNNEQKLKKKTAKIRANKDKPHSEQTILHAKY